MPPPDMRAANNQPGPPAPALMRIRADEYLRLQDDGCPNCNLHLGGPTAPPRAWYMMFAPDEVMVDDVAHARWEALAEAIRAARYEVIEAAGPTDPV